MNPTPERRETQAVPSDPTQAPAFERLEPRLLLSADGADITLLTPLPDELQEGQTLQISALYTDSDVAQDWDSPALVTGVNSSATEQASFLSFDGQTLVFSRDVETSSGTFKRLFTATWDEGTGQWSNVQQITGIAPSVNHADHPWLSPDNLRLYYYETVSSTDRVLKVSERASTSDDWTAGFVVPGFESISAATPTLSADELTIVFASDSLNPGNGYDLFMAQRTAKDQPFGTPVALTNLNTADKELQPTLSADGLTLYFSRRNDAGSVELMRTTRTSTADTFGTPELVVLDGMDNLVSFPTLSPDGQALFFSMIATDQKDLYQVQAVSPVTHQATIDWGDGAAIEDLGNIANIFGAQHTYTTTGQFTVTITVSDSEGGVGITTHTVTVDPRPVISALAVDSSDIDENGTVTVTGTFTDASASDSHTVSIDWGNGDVTQATVDEGTGQFQASYQYLDDDPSGTSADSYTITAVIVDSHGGSDQATATVTVHNVAPTVTLSGVADPVLVGHALTLTAAVTDVGSLDTVDLTWTITRDGSTVASGTGETISYTPILAGDHVVTVTATDDDGGSNSTSVTVEVLDDTLVTTVSGDDTVDEGSEANLHIEITTPSQGAGLEWTNAQLVEAITTTNNEKSSFLTSDGLTLYFSRVTSPPTGNTRLFYVTRTSTADPFLAENVQQITGINPGNGNHADYAWVSEDQLRMYYYITFNSSRKIMFTERASTADPWVDGTEMTEFAPYAAAGATLTADELNVVFVSRNGSLGGYDLWMANRASTADPFGNFTHMGSVINTSAHEVHPSMTGDGLTLFYVSSASGTQRIYRATRDSVQDSFGAGEMVTIDGIPSNEALTYPSITRDGQHLYFDRFLNSDRNVYVADAVGSGSGTPGGSLTVQIDWGDGTVDTLADAAAVLDATHVYQDDGSYTQVITVSNGIAGSQVSRAVTVLNVAPTITGLAVDSAVVNENGSVTLTGAIEDPGTADTHTVTIDWGDGTVGLALVDAASRTFTATHQYLDDAPTGTPSDTVTITATVQDDDGGSSSASTTVTVQNVAPAVSIQGLPALAAEGDLLQLTADVSDPGSLDSLSYTWTVSRDGTVVANESGPTLSLLLEDDGTYQVDLTVTDDDTGVGTAQAVLEVLNVAPLIGGLALSATQIDENGEVTISGSVSDAGVLDTHTVTIDWGDGTVTPGVTVNPDGTFSATHQVLDDDPTGTPSDTLTITVTADDDDGGQVTDSLTLQVDNVAPTAAILGLPAGAVEGDSITLTADAADVGTLDTLSLAWSVQLDGTEVASGDGEGFTFVPQDDGQYTVSLTITDDDGGSTTVTETLAVANADPTIVSLSTGATSVGAVAAGEATTIRVELADAGALDTHTVTLDLGDGTVQTVTPVDGVVEVSHVYGQGGIFTVTATVTDDDGGSVSQQALAVITGVSLSPEGVLNIVGTTQQDVILVRQLGSRCRPDRQTLAIGASFLPGRGYGWMLVDRSLVQRIVILAGDGDDRVHVSRRVDVSVLIDGGAGNDYLRGGANGDVILGSEGYDLLWGGGGNDILIGGEESDLIIGGSGEDILIDGSTVYDIDDSEVMVGFDDALVSLLDEWNSDGTYEERLSNIQNGGGANGLYVLDDSTLIADQAFDILIGCSGQDWLSYFTDDSI